MHNDYIQHNALILNWQGFSFENKYDSTDIIATTSIYI
jgi:hypothetical protein